MAEQIPCPPSPEEIKNRVREIISTISRIEMGEMSEEIRIREELGIDSLMAMEIVATCEKKMGITLDEGELYEIQTVGDFLDLVVRLYIEQDSGSGSVRTA